MIADRTLADRFAFVTSARPWSHWRPRPMELTACSECIRGVCLCVGVAGELWLDIAPFAELTPQLLPEDLLDIWHEGPDWHILGKSGNVYVLRQPTESVARVREPPFRLEKALRLGLSLIGIARQRLLRSDDAGASWQPMSIEPQHPIDVAVDGLGRVAVLEIPERIWQSTDRAGHFVPLDRKNDGVTAFVLERNQIRTASLLHGKALLLPQVTASVVELVAPRLRNPTADYLGASDFLDRRVAEITDRYLVARPYESGWHMRVGSLGKPLDAPRPMQGIACHRIMLTAIRDQVWAMCSNRTPANIAQPITFFVSEDQGHHFVRVEPVLHGVPNSLRAVAIVQPYGLLVSGICPPDTQDHRTTTSQSNASGCRPHGIFRLERLSRRGEAAPTPLSLEPVPTPTLSESALALAATPSGRAVVAIARRAKTGALTLLISQDGGRSFSAKPLSDIFGNDARATRKSPNTTAVDQLGLDSLAVAEDGGISLVTKHGDQPRLFTFDAEGVLLSAADAPKGVSHLSVFEGQALALSVTEGALYESVDHGANFELIAQLSPNPCPDSSSCGLVCRRAGCLVGDRLTRVGYRHQVQPRLSLPTSALHQDELPTGPSERRLASCEISRDGWQRLSAVGTLPNAASSSFGNLAFYMLAIPTNESNVLLAEVTRTQRRLSLRRLFPSSSAANQPAVGLQRHPHGWAAARIKHVGLATAPVGKIDLAWANLIDVKRSSAQLQFGESVGSLSIEKTDQGPVRFAPGWLSPLGDGLLIQLTPDLPNGVTSAHLVSTSGTPVPLYFGGWQGNPVNRTEILSIAGRPTPVVLAGRGMVLLRGSFAEPALTAITIAPKPEPSAAAFDQIEFSRLGNKAGVLVRMPADERNASARRFFQIVSEDSLVVAGPSIPLPFGRSVPLAACDASRRRVAERIVVGTDPRDRVRVMLIRAEATPISLFSKRAVLYVDATSACWDVLEASDDSNATSALLFADAPDKAWIFRPTQDLFGHAAIESATMNCHIEADFQVPPHPDSSETGGR